MWTSRSEELLKYRGLRIVIELDSSAVSFAQILRAWQDDPQCRSLFISLLASSPFTAFRWETPPLTVASSDRAFEFVLLDCPGLAGRADPRAFADQFSSTPSTSGIVEFPNLGKDAILVVPCPNGPPSAYGHLAAFVREAPEPQQHALWERVGAAMERRVDSNPVWLSTAGAGVPWLHVRLDDRPKYYGYGPYRGLAESV
jgi:hypothetical protein